MALRVWLPLNGNLENKGLEGISSITGSPTYGAGKLGQAITAGGTITFNLSNTNLIEEMCLNKEYSIMAWCYNTNTSAGSRWVFGIGSGAGKMRGFYESNSHSQVHWAFSGSGINITDNIDHMNGWHHMCFTVNGTTVTMYIDGIKQGTGTDSSTLPENSVVTIYANNYSLNDFRLYDECLSPKQVKEISKGLIVHYQLKTPGAINNLKRNVSYVPYNNFSSSGSTCTVVKTEETYNGADIWRMTYTPNETSLTSVQSTLHSHGVMMSGQTFTAGTKYCYWTLFKPISHPDTIVGGVASNIGYWTEIPMQEYGGGWYVVGQKRTGNAPEDRSDSIFTSFKTPSATSGTPIIIDFCCPHLVEGYDYILEEFDYRGTNPTYEIDSSGNGYNGTINGTLTLLDDTARYLSSTKFDANTSYIKLPALTTTGFANSFTISCWAKIADMNAKMRWGFSDGNRLNIYPTGSVICCNTGNSANNPYQNNGTSIGYTQWNGGWHQFVMVADGTTNKLYVDGVYQGTAKTYVGLTGTQIYISGWDAGTGYAWTDGLMNDFRIYATALSADDIKELYQTSAMIDNGNNMYAYEFKEE